MGVLDLSLGCSTTLSFLFNIGLKFHKMCFGITQGQFITLSVKSFTSKSSAPWLGRKLASGFQPLFSQMSK